MKKTTFYLLLLITTIFSLNAQVNNSYARESFAEKIYLQTDNHIYTTNSTIWFKTAAVNAATLSGELSSAVLYVDLINANDEVIDSKIIKLSKGLGNGYFDLGANIVDGDYRIRAYTEWNKNFSNDFVFTKTLQVVTNASNAKSSAKKTMKTATLNDAQQVSKSSGIDLQFFPEGGQLINGVTSKIGFKAISPSGLGIAVEGEILDTNNNVIATFKSNDLGMGHFMFIQPNSKKIYKSRVTSIAGETADKMVAFPKVNESGVALQVTEDDNQINIAVNASSYANGSVKLKGFSRGITYMDNPLDLSSAVGNFSIPKTNFPEGIIVFSVYDQQQRIVAERLFFNKNEMSTVSLNANLNKQKFNTRDEVVISMQTEAALQTDKINSYDTSVLVLDKSRIDLDESRSSNILTYLLLTSDLKGHIETPHVYFDTNSTHNIDDLMLTQGWRTYKYDTVVNNVFKFRREMGIPFKGIITHKKAKDADSSKTFTVTDFGREFSLLNTTLNVPGSYYFEIENLYGDSNKIMMEPSSISDKEKSNINIVRSEKQQLPIQNLVSQPIDIEESISKHVVEQQNEIMQIEKAYFENLYGYNQLDEVTVYGYTMTPKRREMAVKFGLPNTVIDGKDIRNKMTESTNGLVDVLMGFRDKVYVETRAKRSIFYQTGGGTNQGPGGRINIGLVQQGPATNQTYLRMGTTQGGRGHINMVVVDGIPVNTFNHYLVEDIEPTEVTSFEIIDDPKGLKQLYAEVFNTNPPAGLLLGSILSIYTRNGIGLFGALMPGKDQNVFNVQGFALSKAFYVPKYDVEDNFYENKPDYRPTIYWDPHVRTKDNENAQVRFYHSDNEGDFVVILETISKDGKVGYKEMEYSVSNTNSD